MTMLSPSLSSNPSNIEKWPDLALCSSISSWISWWYLQSMPCALNTAVCSSPSEIRETIDRNLEPVSLRWCFMVVVLPVPVSLRNTRILVPSSLNSMTALYPSFSRLMKSVGISLWHSVGLYLKYPSRLMAFSTVLWLRT